MSDEVDPSTTVWHIPHSKTNGRYRQVHTNRQCKQLVKAERILGPKEYGKLQKDWGVCDYCSGNVNQAPGNLDVYLKMKDDEFTPDEGQTIEEFVEEMQS